MSIVFDIDEPTKFVIGGKIYTLDQVKVYMNNLKKLIDIADNEVQGLKVNKFVPDFEEIFKRNEDIV